jgi:NADH dehydrogenase
MLLLTGATGVVGSALLGKLVDEEVPVRCLVRDPRRLGALRVRVQIALGDLSDPRSFRNAMRGVDTVAHLATVTRDQQRGSIEELTAMASWKIVQAAQRAGVERFVLLSALGASKHHPARLLRAKALAEQAVRESALRSTIVATSFTYAAHDRWLTLIERLSALPVVPVPGGGRARCQPIWAQDVASCLIAALRQPPTKEHVRYELAGPQALSYNDAVRVVLRCVGHERPLLNMPFSLARRILRTFEHAMGEDVPLAWDEAQLLAGDSLSARGTADAQTLGVQPQTMATVLS